jgi:hypothetical protein
MLWKGGTMKRTIKASAVPAPPAVAKHAEPKKRFSFRVTEHVTSFLQVGDVFDFRGREHKVVAVNETCARIVPITEGTAKPVTFKTRFDKAVEFEAPERNGVISISANSEVTIKRREKSA